MKLIENLKNKFKKNKKQNNKKIQEKPKTWLKVLHVICYILSIIFIIIVLYGCFNPVKKEDNNNNKIVPPNVMEVKETKKENYYNQSGSSFTLGGFEFTNPYVFNLFKEYILNNYDGDYSSDSTRIRKYIDISYSCTYFNSRTGYSLDGYTKTFNRIAYTNYATLSGDVLMLTASTDGSIYIASGGYNGYVSIYTSVSSGNFTTTYSYAGIKSITFQNLDSNLISAITNYIDNGFQGLGAGYSQQEYDAHYDEGYNNGYNVAYNKLTNEDVEYIHFSNYFDWRILLTNAYQNNTGLFYLPYNNGDNQPLFTGLTFSSNGKTYNQIRLNCVFLDTSTKVVYHDYDNNGLVTNYGRTISDIYSANPTGKNISGLVAVTYEYVDSNNSANNYSDVVFTCYDYNATGKDESTSHINNYIDYNVPKWTNDAYKTLVVIEDTGQVANSTYTDVSLLVLLDSNSSVSLSNYNDYLDVFSLLAMGFTSLTSLFNMAILPNITIGMLLFMPLLVIMFITIIKLIKK